ncbi:Very short patch repair protein [subsurface metagenome]
MKRTKEQISYNMSRIKNKGSEIEKILASGLRRNRVKFRRHISIIGRPDFVIKGRKIAVFCDSAFWHGYGGMKTKRHDFKRRTKFWVTKINRNIERDKVVNKTLKREGWKIIRFWDFQIKKDVGKCIRKIQEIINR